MKQTLRIVSIAVFLLSLTTISQAEILFSDDFENGGGKWSYSRPGSGDFTIITDPAKAYKGSSVLQLTYLPGTTGPGFSDATWSRSVSQVYQRWYQKWSSGWIWSGVATKMVKLRPAGGAAPDLFVGVMWGSGYMALQVEGVSGNLEQRTQRFNGGQWYCIEVFADLANNRILAWIDDQEVFNLNQSWGSTTSLGSTLISGYYNEGGSTPNGVPQKQYTWHDEYVVSTQRIGCLPDVGDKTPPKTPTGVRIETQ